MRLTKTNPNITLENFTTLVKRVKTFESITGKVYVVNKLVGNTLFFTRQSTNKEWSVELNNVLDAYKNLTDFRTKNFAPFVPRRHSPSLGLLIHVGLLSINR